MKHLIIAFALGGTMLSALAHAEQHVWPNTDPPSAYDGLSINGVQYKKSEVEPGRWQWVPDQDAAKRNAEYQQRRRALYSALRTRVLTYDELIEVAGFGRHLNIEPGMPYSSQDTVDRTRELNDALWQQLQLQATATRQQEHK